MSVNRTLAAIAATLAVLALLAGNRSRRGDQNAGDFARAAKRPENQVGPLQLAAWIREQKSGLRVIDVRAAGEYADFHIPSAQHASLDTIAQLPPSGTVVLYASDGARDRQAWLLLKSSGFNDVLLLRGGLEAWVDSVLSPPATADAETRELSRYFGGRPASPTDSVMPLAEKVRRIQRRGC